jgi:hypothetical protein
MRGRNVFPESFLPRSATCVLRSIAVINHILDGNLRKHSEEAGSRAIGPDTVGVINVGVTQHYELECPCQIGAALEELFQVVHQILPTVHFCGLLPTGVDEDGCAIELQQFRVTLADVDVMDDHLDGAGQILGYTRGEGSLWRAFWNSVTRVRNTLGHRSSGGGFLRLFGRLKLGARHDRGRYANHQGGAEGAFRLHVRGPLLLVIRPSDCGNSHPGNLISTRIRLE